MSNLINFFKKSQSEWSQKDKVQIRNYLKQLKQFNLNYDGELKEQKIYKCISELEYQHYLKDEFVFHSYEYCDYIYILLDGTVSQLVNKSELEIESEKGILMQIQQLEQLLQRKQQNGQQGSDKAELYLERINNLNQQLEEDNRFNLSRRIKQIFTKSSLAYCQNESYYFDSHFNQICLFKEQNLINSGNLIGEYVQEELRNQSILTNSECHFLKLKASSYQRIFKNEIIQQQKVQEFLNKLGLKKIEQSDIEQISYNIDRIKVKKDQFIFKQGDKAKKIIFLVQKGSFELNFFLNKSIIEESPPSEFGNTIENYPENSKSIQRKNSIQQYNQNGMSLFKVNKQNQNLSEYKLFHVGEGEIFGCEEFSCNFRNFSVISKENKGLIYKIKIKHLKELQDKRIIEKIYNYGQSRIERINRRILELYTFEQKQQSPLKQLNKYYSSSSPSPSNKYFLANNIIEQQQKSPRSNAQTDTTLLISQVTENYEDDNENIEPGSNKMKSIQLIRSHRFQKQTKKTITPISTNTNINYSSRRALSMMDSSLLKMSNQFCMSPFNQKNLDCNSSAFQTSTNFNSAKSSKKKLLMIGNQNQFKNQQFSDFVQLQQLQERQDISNCQQQEQNISASQIIFSSQPTSPINKSKSIEKKLSDLKKQNSQLKNVMNPHQFFHKSKSFLQTQNQIKIQRQQSQCKQTLPQLGVNNSQNSTEQKASQLDSIVSNNLTSSIQDNKLQQSIFYSKMLKSRLMNFLSNQSSQQKKKSAQQENQNSQQKMIKQQQLSLNRLKQKNFNNFSYLKLSELNKQKKQMNQQKAPCSFSSLHEDNSNNISSNNIFQEANTMKDLGHSFTANNSPKQKTISNKGIVYYQFQYQQPLIKQRANSINAYKLQKESRILLNNSPQKNLSKKSTDQSQINSKQSDVLQINKNNLISYQDTDEKLKQTQLSFNNFLSDATINESSKTQILNSTNYNFFEPQTLNLINNMKDQDKPLLHLEFKQNRNAYQPKYKTQNNFYIGKNFNNTSLNQNNIKQKQINTLQQQQMQYLEISPIKIRNTFRANFSQEQDKNDFQKTSTDPGKRSKIKMKLMSQTNDQNIQPNSN